ncbi:hypothetical protein JMA_20050 [Jeotgalibacillus malaysiensis]|uniref:Uncharacterized protein n=1 Tax=Jeotgalibacillus malaysiensis TaxID=1508404 RepID=A0A0B5ART4_9BACL|nr:hypothetical protein [Jeotgalibacillus malaysiensis]AJD91322.1 hypothetical protein JMA_20050 [Jeotgalibacillus malaysiensis]
MNWKKTILIVLFLTAFSAAAFAAYQKGQMKPIEFILMQTTVRKKK